MKNSIYLGTNITVVASAANAKTTITVPTGRGNVKRMSVYVNHNTPADYLTGTFSINSQGQIQLDTAPFAAYAPLFNGGNHPIHFMDCVEGGTVEVFVTNATANPFVISVILFFE